MATKTILNTIADVVKPWALGLFQPKLPTLVSGQYLTNNGTDLSWAALSGQAQITGLSITIPTTGWSLDSGIYNVGVYSASFPASFTPLCVITAATDAATAQACELMPYAMPLSPYVYFYAKRVPTATISIRVLLISGSNNYGAVILPTYKRPTQITGVTLTAANWTLVNGLYEYTYSNALIAATTSVEFTPANASIATVEAAKILPRTDSAAGSVKIYSTNLPGADIAVDLLLIEVV